MDADDNNESGFSEEEGNSKKHVDGGILQSNGPEHNGKSHQLYAAVRLYIEKGEVDVISTNDQNKLINRSKRWPKPKKSRSTVVHQLAEEALQKEKSVTVNVLIDAQKQRKLTYALINTEDLLTQKTMFHIHYGVSVPNRNWKNALAAQSSYEFLRELVPHIWSQDEFVIRAVQVQRTDDYEDRVDVTPRKKEVLKRGYVQYLVERGIIQINVETDKDKKKRN
ncbi:hypothetical protein TSAR_006392 [Trichomalopsis sarcophagae]|uniref:Uncharacterized protein n=1 Tax=Trichomalopsis sarcophagae TaxID=543379 RepID=A0A232EG28_9HYME|nr:hypothetical protein TSAR_006392 [Trichomalopsis sarcophagae]